MHTVASQLKINLYIRTDKCYLQAVYELAKQTAGQKKHECRSMKDGQTSIMLNLNFKWTLLLDFKPHFTHLERPTKFGKMFKMFTNSKKSRLKKQCQAQLNIQLDLADLLDRLDDARRWAYQAQLSSLLRVGITRLVKSEM